MDDPRIAQFKKMTESDPQNELGHFSLGKTYLELGDFVQAVPVLRRALELAPQNSRAYYLLAVALKETGDCDGAVEVLRKGYEVATSRGDRMPQKEMAALMKTLGVEPPPEAELAAPALNVAANASNETAGTAAETIVCRRCGQRQPKMEKRPFKGPLGERIWAEVCGTCWRAWIPMGTKVINEMRLNFTDPQHSDIYDHYMKQWLNLE